MGQLTHVSAFLKTTLGYTEVHIPVFQHLLNFRDDDATTAAARMQWLKTRFGKTTIKCVPAAPASSRRFEFAADLERSLQNLFNLMQ